MLSQGLDFGYAKQELPRSIKQPDEVCLSGEREPVTKSLGSDALPPPSVPWSGRADPYHTESILSERSPAPTYTAHASTSPSGLPPYDTYSLRVDREPLRRSDKEASDSLRSYPA